jgi:hypothetical protein
MPWKLAHTFLLCALDQFVATSKSLMQRVSRRTDDHAGTASVRFLRRGSLELYAGFHRAIRIAMVNHVPLANARWSKKPPVPLAALSIAVGLGAFSLVLLALRSVTDESFSSAVDGARIGLTLAGFAMVGGAFAAVRAVFRGNLMVSTTPDSLRIGDREIPYTSIRRVEFANRKVTKSVSAGSEETSVDAILHVLGAAGNVRLIAPDTYVDDFMTAFDALMKQNPDALVVPLELFR